MKKELIIGKQYKNYGKYLGITRIFMYGKYDYKEHRFSIPRGLNETAFINRVKIEDNKTLERIINDN